MGRGVEGHGVNAGVAIRASEVEGDALDLVGNGFSQPVLDALTRSGHLDRGEGDVAAQAGGQQLGRGGPLDEERKLRVSHQALDTDLAPLEVTTIGEGTVTGHRLTLEALLVGGEIVDGDGPPHPSAALFLTCAHGLAEDGLLGCGVVQHLHNLDVTRPDQRQNAVAGSKARMDSAVDE